MADEALAPLTRAVAARRAGRTPSRADLAECARRRWKRGLDGLDLSTWNGGPGAPLGSQNIPVLAEAGLGNWPFHVVLARTWRSEGLFGMEIGSPAGFYYEAVLDAMLLAYREWKRSPTLQRFLEPPEEIRLAVRAALALDALSAVPVPRTHDEVLLPHGKILTGRLGPKTKRLSLAVAVSGNRWTHVQRGDLTSQDAHSAVLDAALHGTADYGLATTERLLLASTVRGEQDAARGVAQWLAPYGTIDKLERRWRFRIRRTALGVESVFFGPAPNPYKPCRSVTQQTLDGLHRGMQPSELGRGAWSAGYQVTEHDDVDGKRTIRAGCADGEAEIEALGGELLWELTLDGKQVKLVTM